MKPASGVFLRNRHDQTKVCLRQLVLRRLVALAHALCQLHLLVCRQKPDLPDFLEVHAHRVVEVILCRQLHGVDQLFLFVSHGDIALAHAHAHAVVGVVETDFQLRADNLDAHCVERVVNMFNLFYWKIQLLKLCGQLRRLNAALALCLCNQRADGCHGVFCRNLRILCICHLCSSSFNAVSRAKQTLFAQPIHYIPQTAFLTSGFRKFLLSFSAFFRRTKSGCPDFRGAFRFRCVLCVQRSDFHDHGKDHRITLGGLEKIAGEVTLDVRLQRAPVACAAGKAAVNGVRCNDAQLFHEIF